MPHPHGCPLSAQARAQPHRHAQEVFVDEEVNEPMKAAFSPTRLGPPGSGVSPLLDPRHPCRELGWDTELPSVWRESRLLSGLDSPPKRRGRQQAVPAGYANTLQECGEAGTGCAQALGSIPASSHVAFCPPGPRISGPQPCLRPLLPQDLVWRNGFLSPM